MVAMEGVAVTEHTSMVTPAFGELIRCMVQDPVVQACTAGTIMEKLAGSVCFSPPGTFCCGLGLAQRR
jgi:hypothetical protein